MRAFVQRLNKARTLTSASRARWNGSLSFAEGLKATSRRCASLLEEWTRGGGAAARFSAARRAASTGETCTGGADASGMLPGSGGEGSIGRSQREESNPRIGSFARFEVQDWDDSKPVHGSLCLSEPAELLARALHLYSRSGLSSALASRSTGSGSKYV